MSDLALYAMTDLIDEMKRRDISFIIAYTDHQEFHKRKADEGIVWACDAGGNLVLQTTLLRFLREWHHQVVKHRCDPSQDEETP